MTREAFIAQLSHNLSAPPQPARALIGSEGESRFGDWLTAGRSDAYIAGDPDWASRQLRADAGFKRCWRELGAMQAIVQESSDDA